jgi:hypothetical protein
MKKGYLVFTTHDGDEVSVYFLPESDKEIFEKLAESGTNDEALKTFYDNYGNKEPERFWTQTLCNEPWPFSNYEIIGTHYFLTY